ncbi:MAG: triose-phosphate isomerase [Candidatus Berkelbacteria bacterium]|nr:triose-phosphate isomerase [Candidatus Berkelbacteria bacterium]
MKRSIIVGNWKMYATSIADAHILATTIRNKVAPVIGIEVVLCPPALWLPEIKNILGDNKKILLGAQNMAYEEEGAFTGEIAPSMVAEMAKFCIVGHSERRQYFDESDQDVNEKVLAALKHGITPIICVGERKRQNNAAEPTRQLAAALYHVPKKYFKDIIVAYEPIWAIGTGENAEPEYVAKVAVKLRELLHTATPILYGGSVKGSNIAGYAERPEIDGVLVGGASVRAAEFIEICRVWSNSKNFKS